MSTDPWPCARCGTRNDAGTIACSSCGLLRGSLAPPDSITATTQPPDGTGEGSAPVRPPTATAEMGSDNGSSSLWRRLPLGWILSIGIVAIIGVGGVLFSAGRSDSGDIDRAGDLAATDLRAGDCFDLKGIDADTDEIDDVRAIPCSETHQYEVFFVGDVPGDAFPTDPDTTFEDYVVEQCLPAWEAFVGLSYSESTLEIFYFFPTSASWSGGDHSIQCAIYDPREAELVGSLEAVAR